MRTSHAVVIVRFMELIGDLERAFAEAIYPNRVLIAVLGGGAVALLAVLAWRRRWDRPVRRHPRASGVGLISALIIGLPLGWYLASPLFISTRVDEPDPVAATAPTARPTTSEAPSAPVEPSAPPVVPSQTAAASPTPLPLVDLAGRFTGADDFHFGEGNARLIETASGMFTVRLEDFAVRNGPDLFVYLSPSAEGYADGAIELGRLKADRGNQNYKVPRGTNIADAASVVIWCKRFGVLFATAPLE